MPRREADPDFYCPQAALVDKDTAERVERRLSRYRAKVKAQQAAVVMMKQQHQQHQQQRMLWAASGALLIISATYWMWYKKSKKQQRRGGGNNNQSQLFLHDDDDNEFNGTPEQLQQVFNEAAKVARSFPKEMLDQRDQLMMYGLYKQALQGDVTDETHAPSNLNVVARAKYDAWKKFQGLPQQFAMEQYCKVVYHFANGGASSFQQAVADENADVVYHDQDDDDETELDEDGCPIHQDQSDVDYSGMMGIRQSTLSSSVPNKQIQPSSSTSSPEVCLRNAALSSDKVMLEDAINNGADINDPDEIGQTALHFAADKGCIDCLNLLLNAGANVNAIDQDGIGVLQTAVIAGIDAEGVRVLMEAGADPYMEDNDGDSPHSTVLEEGRQDIIDVFDLYPSR
jgi:acyl-CoA-binding protein